MDLAINCGPMSGQNSVAVFEHNRRVLQGAAYRMLGELGAAEDAVQETYLRWHKADHATIAFPRAWLLTTCARICIDELRSARARRETYVGPWLPEPLLELDQPADPFERSEQISIAFLLLLQELGPAERAAYVMREVFDVDYAEIARSLGRTATACRQLVSRAARRVGATSLPDRADLAATERFATALARGDSGALTRLLTEDAVLMSDGGGKVVSALNPIRGADRVTRFLVGIGRKSGHAFELRPVAVNGDVGLAILRNGALFAVVGFAFERLRIAAIYVIRNPDKLARSNRKLDARRAAGPPPALNAIIPG